MCEGKIKIIVSYFHLILNETIKNEETNLSKCFTYVVPKIKKPGTESRLCLILLVARRGHDPLTSGL